MFLTQDVWLKKHTIPHAELDQNAANTLSVLLMDLVQWQRDVFAYQTIHTMWEVRVCPRKDMDNRVVTHMNVKTMLEWFVVAVLVVVIRLFSSITRLLVHVNGWLVQTISVWLVASVNRALATGLFGGLLILIHTVVESFFNL